jgi:BlaI family penicillinase repressor
MGKSVPHITSAELNVLKVLWKSSAATVREVKDALAAEAAEPLAYTTVMTLMNQLAAKGALEVDRSRQPFIYKPAVRREQVLAQRLKQFVHSVFDGQAGELVLRLVDEAEISPEDLKKIEQRIEQRERDESTSPRKPGSKGGRP